MELVTFAKDVLQTVAEHAASYQIGQSALKHLDKTLWVVEKCARWAVPPPLEQDERPPQELIRPLPWLLFLPLLVVLRITRESISLVNLARGKPPLRSADVVMYIQGKRRYIRTLKYQGSRVIRARTCNAPTSEPWYNGLYSLMRFTMCFRRQSHNYGNNNTTHVSNNEEILVVKRVPRGRQESSPTPCSSSDTPMERLIERMMIDLDAESDEESTYTLTNAASTKSDISDTYSEPEENKSSFIDSDETSPSNPNTSNSSDLQNSSSNSFIASTPEKAPEKETSSDKELNKTFTQEQLNDVSEENKESPKESPKVKSSPTKSEKLSPKKESQKLIRSEKCSPPKQQPPKKMANGRTVKSAPGKKRGGRQDRDSDVPVVRITPADEHTGGAKETVRSSHQ